MRHGRPIAIRPAWPSGPRSCIPSSSWRWQRRSRTHAEAAWDAVVGRLLHLGDAGVELDRLLTRAVPAQVVAQIDDSVNLLVRKPPIDEDEDDEAAPADETDRLTASLPSGAVNMAEIADDEAERDQEKSLTAPERS